jgi:hypothetical protein
MIWKLKKCTLCTRTRLVYSKVVDTRSTLVFPYHVIMPSIFIYSFVELSIISYEKGFNTQNVIRIVPGMFFETLYTWCSNAKFTCQACTDIAGLGANLQCMEKYEKQERERESPWRDAKCAKHFWCVNHTYVCFWKICSFSYVPNF